jgi:hypothetical protein
MNIFISEFENMEGQFDCLVNKECFSKENSFDEFWEKSIDNFVRKLKF